MRLDDDVEATGSHEAVGARKGHALGAHDFGDTYGCAAGDADAAVDEGCDASASSAVWIWLVTAIEGEE